MSLSVSSPSFEVRPITLRAANAFVELHHRHHKPARGCVFCVSVWLQGVLVGCSESRVHRWRGCAQSTATTTGSESEDR